MSFRCALFGVSPPVTSVVGPALRRARRCGQLCRDALIESFDLDVVGEPGRGAAQMGPQWPTAEGDGGGTGTQHRQLKGSAVLKHGGQLSLIHISEPTRPYYI